MEFPKRRSGLVAQERTTGDGTVLVYDSDTGAGHLLNPAAAAVFAAADGATSRSELVAAVAASTGLPADESLLDLALSELDAAGLLSAAESPRSMSRRTVIKRLALAGAAVAVLPTVVSVLKADRASAGSPTLMVHDAAATTPDGVPVDVSLSTTGGFSGPDSTLFWVTSVPSNGTVELVGSVATYTPDPGFTGEDSFMYTAGQCISFADVVAPACPEGTGLEPPSGAAEPATVTITVTAQPTTTTTADSGVAPAAAARVTASPQFTG